jgi:hypothetical protein
VSDKYYPSNLYINTLKQSTNVSSDIHHDIELKEVDQFLKPLYLVNEYYGTSLTTMNNLGEGYCTSLELGLKVSQEYLTEFEYIFYAQNNPDYRTLNSPLAPILEHSNFQYHNFMGITHLDYVSGLEGLKLIDHLFKGNALFLITESPIGDNRNSFNQLVGGASVGITLNRTEGIKVNCIMSKLSHHNGKHNPGAFHSEINRFYDEFSKEIHSEYVIIQSTVPTEGLSFKEDLFVRENESDIDFLSNDSWITFTELLERGNISGSVTLISTDHQHRICFCNVSIAGVS